MKYALLLLALGLTACAGPEGIRGPAGQVTVVPVPVDTNLDTVEVVVKEYNEGRLAQGQSLISPGLSCTLYTVPNTTTLIVGATLTTVGSWTYTGMFNDLNGSSAPGISVLPAQIRSIYTSYYMIKCTGMFIAPQASYYTMDLSSDDGAIVKLNGNFLSNDGVHGITSISGTKFLNRGVYSFEVDYFDIGGSHALILKMNGSLLSPDQLYH